MDATQRNFFLRKSCDNGPRCELPAPCTSTHGVQRGAHSNAVADLPFPRPGLVQTGALPPRRQCRRRGV